ncbi:glucose PTS transporter subunit IIA [Butyrivibrio sp. AE3004]|uniref:glucose PTS transporter subunit IIA n=1 Tax=Butyrivibrio sp. AE3004 TaxID=1506994 RepID=UPI00068E30E6|nr:glucose PTS transporter subunit IIA [Butyrivibrio sp. AE3004]
MKKHGIKLYLKTIGDIFIPLLPGVICAGLCGGVASIIAQAVPGYEKNEAWRFIYQILTLINTSVMTYLTAWAGYRATEQFGGTPILGGMLGMITAMDGINVISSVLGLYNSEVPLDSILRSGKGGVLAVIAGAVLIANVEKVIRSVMPRAVDVIFTPILTMFVCLVPYIVFIMPLFGYVSEGIIWLFGRACLSGNIFVRALSGYFAAAFFLPLVAMGMHHGLVALYSVQLQELGYITLYPALAMAGAGQVGAALAIWKKARKAGNKEFCSVIAGALPAGLMGVGEPLIYGVTLPLGIPFLTAGLGAGFGGAFIMLTQVASTGWGPSGLLGAFLMTAGQGGRARSVLFYLIALVISYVGGYVITNLFYGDKELNVEISPSEEQVAFWRSSTFARLCKKKPQLVRAGDALMELGGHGMANLAITAAADGETVPMKEIPDIIFSSGVIGRCIGIMPENGHIYAPCDGVIAEIADTNHAMTFRIEDGMEIILLIGIDTFTLSGEGLCPLVNVGEKVTAGQAVLEADLEKINNAGLSPIVITVMSNQM